MEIRATVKKITQCWNSSGIAELEAESSSESLGRGGNSLARQCVARHHSCIQAKLQARHRNKCRNRMTSQPLPPRNGFK